MRPETRSTTRRRTAPRSSTRPAAAPARNVRRPDLVPGVDPFIQDGGLLILNPAAFATPKPGTNGNLERNSIHGPNFWQVDAVIAKRIGPARGPSGELRMEIFNLFNHANSVGRRGLAAERAADQQLDGSEPGSTGAAVYVCRGGHVRPRHVNGRHDGRHRHQPPDPARVPIELLTDTSRGMTKAGQLARPLCFRPGLTTAIA